MGRTALLLLAETGAKDVDDPADPARAGTRPVLPGSDPGLPSSHPASEYWYRHGSCSRARMPDQMPVIREHDVQTDLHSAEQSCMNVIGVYMRDWQIRCRSLRDHLLALDQLVSTSFHAGGITPALTFCVGMFWDW